MRLFEQDNCRTNTAVFVGCLYTEGDGRGMLGP